MRKRNSSAQHIILKRNIYIYIYISVRRVKKLYILDKVLYWRRFQIRIFSSYLINIQINCKRIVADYDSNWYYPLRLKHPYILFLAIKIVLTGWLHPHKSNGAWGRHKLLVTWTYIVLTRKDVNFGWYS